MTEESAPNEGVRFEDHDTTSSQNGLVFEVSNMLEDRLHQKEKAQYARFMGGRRSQIGAQVESEKPTAPSVGFGSASRFDNRNTQFISKNHSKFQVPVWTPGPGQYPKNGANGPQARSDLRSSASFSFSTSNRFGDADPLKTPGPGTYKEKEQSTFLSTRRKAGVTPFGYDKREDRVCHKGMEEGFYCRESRGPGSYESYAGLGKQVDSKATMPMSKFGTEAKATDPNRPNASERRAAAVPAPGAYFQYESLGKAKAKAVFGKAAARPGDSTGPAASARLAAAGFPGPELKIPSGVGAQTLSTKPTNSSWRFSGSQRFEKYGKNGAPGPGAYMI